MDFTATKSVSKGVFVFKNGTKKKFTNKQISLVDTAITNQQYYKEYLKAWNKIKYDFENAQKLNCNNIIEELIKFIEESQSRYQDKNILSTAALLTGINQPDHYEKFKTLSKTIAERINSSKVAIIQSRDCDNIKSAIESMVYEFVVAKIDDDDPNNCEHKRLRKNQCTMNVLSSWYENECTDEEKILVVILPDFECFKTEVLQDFILIISSYCNQLSMVLVLGVATALSTLHNTLPYHVISKIRLNVFQNSSASIGLHYILDEIILSPKHFFHLSGKTFKFLTDIFLFYDFSISGFVQGLKYCLMEHFSKGKIYSLCSDYEDCMTKICTFKHEDYELIRQLPSFRKLLDSTSDSRKILLLLLNDQYLQKKLNLFIRNCHIHFNVFRCFLELLTSLVQDLPKSPMGKYVSDLYCFCISQETTETDEFKECWQLLKFYSKEEFENKFTKSIKRTEKFLNEHFLPNKFEVDYYCHLIVSTKLKELTSFINKVVGCNEKLKTLNNNEFIAIPQNRRELKENVLKLSKVEKPISEFSKSVNETLDFLKTEIVYKFLRPLHIRGPVLYELIVFSDISTVRKNIVGAPRAALHAALNDPHCYMQCNCCKLNNLDSLVPTMPDLSMVYKLHLECGRMINLFDWMKAFQSIVDYSEEDQDQVDPLVQARFTNAVAELQFLGYIKTSKRKLDHVQRLTW